MTSLRSMVKNGVPRFGLYSTGIDRNAHSICNPRLMAHQREIIVIGGSAGGVEAVGNVLRQLPPDIPAAVFVVCHQMPASNAHLVNVLNIDSPLLAKCAEDGEEI